MRSIRLHVRSCGKHDFTDIRQFNLMFKTFQGVTEDAKNTVYLTSGDCTGYLRKLQKCTENFHVRSSHLVSARSVKSFRNEITPGNFTFRTREFEQMELEFFCEPGTDLEWFQYWRQDSAVDWLQSTWHQGGRDACFVTILRRSCSFYS